MTKSKNKVSLLGLVIAFVFMVAGIFMFVPNNIATVSAQDLDKDIHFSLATNNEKLVFAPNAQTVGAVTITYTVTNTNDGINNLVFIPAYNHDVFAIDEITVNADTNLGDATITNGYSSYTGDYVKLAFDSTTLFDAKNVTLVTITYNTKENLTYLNNGEYNFSLVLNYTDLTQTRSTAYYILGDENLGEQEEVEIIVDDVNVELFIQQSGSLNITDATVEYDANPVGISLNGENEVNYSFTGNGNITWTWYSDENYQNEISAPTNAGTYYLKGTMATTDVYVGTTVQSAVTVNKLTASVVIDNKTSAYGDAIVELTHQAPTGLIGEDTLVINLSTTATSSSSAGTYSITGTVGTGSNPNYNVTFTDGTYTITARAITIKANDQSAQYTGSEPTVDQTAYTVTGATIESGVVITKQAGVNVGSYTLTPSYTNPNYSITFENGTFYITSVGKDAEYIFSFFSGDTVTYDATSHDLLVVNNQIPSWIAYQPSNNVQTNAGEYTIGITVTLSAQDAANYTNGTTQFNSTVTGTITPKALEITAANEGHTYGNTPATLEPEKAGLNNEVDVTFTVYKNYGDETQEAITLSTTTPVGTYTIVPSATSTNYAFTFNNGTYTVSKETATISISAEGIIYSRELNYTVSNAKVGTLDAPYTVEIRNSNNQVVTGVLPVGDYTIIATVADTDNYNGATAQATFTVTPNVVGKPIVDLEQEIEEIHFDKDTVTWDAVTKDIFGNDLYNTTVTYRIGGVEYNNRSFTATSAGSYVLEILSSNENYLSNQVTLTVYSVTFTEGSHPASSNAEVEGLPATQYRFEGETATQPNATPTVAGYTFNGWGFDFETEIEENTEIPALWTISQRTMTVIVMHSGSEYSGTFTVDYNAAIDTTKSITQQGNLVVRANIAGMIDTHYDKDGMHYTFANSWNYKVTGSEAEYAAAPASVNATENYTFIAVYNATPIEYEITYYFSIDGAPYTQSIVDPSYLYVNYGSTINYVTPNSQKWFRVEAWYLDEERTQVAPVTMPAHDLTVYGALVFNVGKGDVNGDGYVDANDITLYRRWIVGGYEITALLNNEDLYEASEMETVDPSDTVYFIARVADTNAATFEAETLGDGSKDIRDVSTIRMGLVGGYGFSIVENVDVTGEDLIIIREFEVESANDLLALARSGAKVTLSEDITDATLDAEILDSNKDIIIDLHGHTLTLKSFRVTLAQGNTGKILVTNGRINVSDGNGVYLTAVDGSVHLDNVTLYDDNGLFVIQTANHSLHLFNVVRFLKREIVNNEPVEAAAEVLVVKDSHIVVEENATLQIDKVVVAEIVEVEEEQQIVEKVVPVEENSDAEITVIINSDAVTEIPVEGDKVSYEIATIEQLDNVVANGSYKLVADLDYSTTYTERNARDYDREHKVDLKNITLDLNGHTISTINASVVFGGNGATIKNGTFNLIKKNTDGSFKEGSYALIIDNNVFEYGENGTVTVEDVTCIGAVNVCCATVTLNNVSAQTTPTKFYTVWAEQNAHVTINSGNFVDEQTKGKGVLATGTGEEGGATITVNGGTFTANNKVVYNAEANSIQIVGGTFSKDPTAYVAQGYYAEEVNNAYVVKQGISNQAQLLEAAANGGSYKVVADFTVNQEVDIEKDFTLDGGNHTITFNKQDSNYYAFYVISENVLSASFSNLNIVSTGYQVAIMTNLDAEGSLVNVNNVDITCDGECIYANGFGVVNANNCDFTRNGKYAQGKDDVYYSALTVGYAGTINATNCTVISDRNGVSTFPSGGTINLTNVDVTVTANDASAIWSRNEDYNVSGYEAYCLDSVITINGGNIVGGLKLTDKNTTGNKNYHEPRIVITGGTFDNDPTAYVAEGYTVQQNSDVYTVVLGVSEGIGTGEGDHCEGSLDD